MKLLVLKLSLILLIFNATIFAVTLPEKPENFANRFYQTYLKLQVRGLPDKKQLKLISPYLSQDLYDLFKDAQLEKERFIKENPVDMKPPWEDGDLFTSLFEGAQSFKIGRVVKRQQYVEVSIRLKYVESRKPIIWNDRLVLIKSKDSWRVWNILLDGNWQFKNGGSLRQILGAR